MKRKVFLNRLIYGLPQLMFGGQILLHSSCRNELMVRVNDDHNQYYHHDDYRLNNNNNYTTVDEFKTPVNIPKEINSGSLNAQYITANLSSEFSTRALGYDQGGILGPTLSLEKGEMLNIQFTNQMGDNSNIHWHGLTPPANMDGHPEDIIASGDSFLYLFKVDNRAGTYWYHPHPVHHTASQVYKGLAGMIYVRDSIEKELNLPSGDREIPLIIQDKRAINTSLEYSVNQHEVIWGLTGDFVCINGVYQPFHSVGTSTYRLRILNGSNARTYDLGFSNDLPFHLIGSDCGLLEQSHALNTLTMGPAERADILVDFSKQNMNTTVFLIDKNNYDRKLMKFVVEKEHNDHFEIPNQLSNLDKINPESASKTRRFTLSDHSMMGMNQVHKINGKSYDKYRIDEVVKSNTTEIWEFDNTNSVVDHPMHLHGVQFQVLERIGGRNRLIPSETAYKDTFLVRAGEKVKIIIPFGDNKGKYVFHCHNLEHENNGMMLQYEIT